MINDVSRKRRHPYGNVFSIKSKGSTVVPAPSPNINSGDVVRWENYRVQGPIAGGQSGQSSYLTLVIDCIGNAVISAQSAKVFRATFFKFGRVVPRVAGHVGVADNLAGFTYRVGLRVVAANTAKHGDVSGVGGATL